MRNETMHDKLREVFQVGGTPNGTIVNEVLREHPRLKIKPKNTPRSPLPSRNTNHQQDPLSGPRYIPPPRRANPFSVHAFSSGPVSEPPQLEAQIEMEPEPELEAPQLEASSGAVKIPEIPAPDDTPKEIEQPAAVSRIEESTESVAYSAPSLIRQADPQRGPSLVSAPVPVPIPIEDAPLVNLPPNLGWLQKPTPFSANLGGIVDSLRDARQSAIFVLKEHEGRAQGIQKQMEVLQKQLDTEQWGMEVQRENLRNLDNTISACALVAEQSAGIDPALLIRNGKPRDKMALPTHKRNNYKANGTDPDSLIGSIRKFFDANPGVTWNAQEVLDQLPPSKRATAKKSIVNVTLASLAIEGKIQRVTVGSYRLTGT